MYANAANVAYMHHGNGKTYTDSEVLMALRRMVKVSSVRKAGAALGVSGAYVHDVLKGRRGLSENLGEALGFALVPPPPAANRKWVRQ